MALDILYINNVKQNNSSRLTFSSQKDYNLNLSRFEVHEPQIEILYYALNTWLTEL